MTALWDEACLWARLAWHYAVVQTWRDLPGPWPVKAALVGICVAIPGPQDELLLLAFARACRAWRRRQAGGAR